MTRQALPSDPLLWLRENADVSPPDGAEARVAMRLAAALSAPPARMPSPSASEPPATAPERRSAKMLADRFVRWSLLPLGLGVGLGVGVSAGRGAARDGEQLLRPVLKPVVTMASALGAARASESAERAPSGPEVRAPVPAASASVSAKSSLAAERDLLDRARRQLASGEAARALGFLEQHARRFPRGQLSEEREAMWVNVLSLLGRGSEAKARGDAFEQRFPRSLMGSSVRAAMSAAGADK